MFRVFLLLFCVLPLWGWLLLMPAGANERDVAQAHAFVHALSDEVIDILKTPMSPDTRMAAFQDILDRRFDVKRTARFALGRYARSISKDDFATYILLANEFIIKIYAARLSSFSNEHIVLRDTQLARNNFITRAQLVFQNGRPPLDIAFWSIRNKAGKISLFDIQVAGIWMAQEQRASFTSILNNNSGNIDSLLAHIRAKING